MLLYLTSNGKSSLADRAAEETGVLVKKLSGKFSLRSFVTRDMRNYSTARFFAVDRSCVEESAGEFITALQSFQMICSARIIAVLSGCPDAEDCTERLLSIGVTNIVSADSAAGAGTEFCECLSDEGMQRYLSPCTSRGPEPVEDAEGAPQVERYVWNTNNVRVALAGAQRRSGVTVTAFNLAAWLTARGASVAYVELTAHQHLSVLAALYDAAEDEGFFTLDGIDCYAGGEPARDYNFILYDCGEMPVMAAAFTDADTQILCGSMLPYELPAYHKALAACAHLHPVKVGLAVSDELREYCRTLFGDILIAEPSHSLFDGAVNDAINRAVSQRYIAVPRRL